MWVGKHKYIFISMTAMSMIYLAGIIISQTPGLSMLLLFFGGMMLGHVASKVPSP